MATCLHLILNIQRPSFTQVDGHDCRAPALEYTLTMVILTMSHPIVEAIHTRNEVVLAERPAPEADPSLQIPAVGKPISHGQIVELWNDLRAHGHDKFSLEYLLRGSRVYIPPPPPKPETVSPLSPL